MEFVRTETESEALLLEANLIKRLKPRFNVLLRDDKSFPYILIATDHEAPELMKHRGIRRRKGHYFGPFASALAVKRTITALQKAFLLRTCSDSFYKARTRPCMLHQIKRCAAPCTGEISIADYAELVEDARASSSPASRKSVQDHLADGHERGRRDPRFRARRPAARPPLRPRPGPEPGRRGGQDRRGSRRLRHRPRGRAVLRPGLLLPRLPELGQPRLPAARRRRPGRRRSARSLHRPVLRRPHAAPAGPAQSHDARRARR